MPLSSETICEIEKALLGQWSRLSPGDRSVMHVILDGRSAQALTVAGSAHARFWEDLILLGWADPAETFLDLDAARLDAVLIEKARASMRAYRLTDRGRGLIPRLIAQYDEIIAQATPLSSG